MTDHLPWDWPLDRVLAEPDRFWWAFNLRLAREHLRGARRMLARGDDIGIVVGINALVEADKAHQAARAAIRRPWSAQAWNGERTLDEAIKAMELVSQFHGGV